jgi:hypothetical protein
MSTTAIGRCQPWNKGKFVRQKAPHRLRDIWEPVAVTEFAATQEQAVHGAAQKMVNLRDSTHGRLRADRNIGELLQTLQANFHQLRQAGIDEELFDVISAFDALLPSD